MTGTGRDRHAPVTRAPRGWLDEVYAPERVAPGCYWIERQWQKFLWIAANELPLLDELVPFLLARSG